MLDVKQSEYRSCDTCRYEDLDGTQEPCCNCQENHVRGNYPNMHEPAEADNVNHPSHYCTGSFECIDVMLEIYGETAVRSFCLCNAFKYLYRCGRKNGLEDLNKAKWYLDKLTDLMEE